MKRTTLKIAALAVSLINVYPGSAGAQLLLDQSVGGTIAAGTELGAAAHQPVPTDVLIQRLQQQGYSSINVSPTDPRQFTATSPAGTAVILTTEPLTGRVLSAVPQ